MNAAFAFEARFAALDAAGEFDYAAYRNAATSDRLDPA
jgi:hypothetical protein